MATTTSAKTCTVCGMDVSAVKRTKDAAGRYYCQPCYAKASARPAPPAASSPATEASVAPAPTTVPRSSPSSSEPAGRPNNALPQASGLERAEAALGGSERYAGSPVLKLVRAATASVGWSPSSRPGQARLLAAGKWVLMAIPVLIAMAFLALGTRLFPAPGRADGGTSFLVLVGVVCLLAFVPLSIGLVIRLGLLAALTRRTWVRVTSAGTACVLIATLVFAWPRLSEVWTLLSAGGRQPLAFADLDNKLGFGALTSPSQWSKTSQQMSDEAAGLLGRPVAWTGQVADVRDGQVLIDMQPTSLKNEAALVVGWWDRWKLAGLNRGDQVAFSGVLARYADPYPFTVAHGTIRSTRAAPQVAAADPGKLADQERIRSAQAAAAQQQAADARAKDEALRLAAQRDQEAAARAAEASRWHPFQPQKADGTYVEYDRFAQRTEVGTTRGTDWMVPSNFGGDTYRYIDRQNGYGFYACVTYAFKGDTIQSKPGFVAVHFYYRSSNTRDGMFSQDAIGDPVSFVVDGRAIQAKIADSGSDEVLVIVPIDSAVAIAGATSVEARVGVTQFQFTAYQLGGFGKMLRVLGVLGSVQPTDAVAAQPAAASPVTESVPAPTPPLTLLAPPATHADPGLAAAGSLVGDWEGKGLSVEVREAQDGSLAMTQPNKGYSSTAYHLVAGAAVFHWSNNGEVLVLRPTGDGTANLDCYPRNDADAIDAGHEPSEPAMWRKHMRKSTDGN